MLGIHIQEKKVLNYNLMGKKIKLLYSVSCIKGWQFNIMFKQEETFDRN